jgi:hypothetical protein
VTNKHHITGVNSDIHRSRIYVESTLAQAVATD